MLNFDYCERSSDSRADYRGLVIRAVQDTDAENPWTDCDGFAPLLWHSLGNREATEHGDAGITAPLAAFSDAAISRHWIKLAAIIVPDLDAAAHSRELVALRRQNPPQWRATLAALKRETLEEALSDRADESSWPSDYFDLLAELWTLAGCESLAFQRNGYSQGDSVLGLLVATPAWRKAMGIPAKRDMASDFESQANVFGAWAFGDCYGFAIESPEGEHLDSCFGYIGSDFAESGLSEAATESADHILADAAKRRGDKLKELIRNRVPVALRPSLLADASKLESC